MIKSIFIITRILFIVFITNQKESIYNIFLLYLFYKCCPKYTIEK